MKIDQTGGTVNKHLKTGKSDQSQQPAPKTEGKTQKSGAFDYEHGLK
jgi:hypothetical protein